MNLRVMRTAMESKLRREKQRGGVEYKPLPNVSFETAEALQSCDKVERPPLDPNVINRVSFRCLEPSE